MSEGTSLRETKQSATIQTTKTQRMTSFVMIAIVLAVSAGLRENARVTGTDHNYLEVVTPVYYPKTDSYYVSSEDLYGCEESYHDPDGDCITGRGGIDYPVFSSLPVTDFECKHTRHPGYYADVDAYCQVFHICEANGRQHSVLCPKGTIFNQEVLVCDWWYNVDCSSSVYYYEKNAYIYQGPSEAQSGYGSRASGAPKQYEPYEEEEDYYDVVEPPYAANVYNRRSDTTDNTDETTTATVTTTTTPRPTTTVTTGTPTTTVTTASKRKVSTPPKIKIKRKIPNSSTTKQPQQQLKKNTKRNLV